MILPKLSSTIAPLNHIKLPTMVDVIVTMPLWSQLLQIETIHVTVFSEGLMHVLPQPQLIGPEMTQGHLIHRLFRHLICPGMKSWTRPITFSLSGIGTGKYWIRWLVVKVTLEGDKRNHKTERITTMGGQAASSLGGYEEAETQDLEQSWMNRGINKWINNCDLRCLWIFGSLKTWFILSHYP